MEWKLCFVLWCVFFSVAVSCTIPCFPKGCERKKCLRNICNLEEEGRRDRRERKERRGRYLPDQGTSWRYTGTCLLLIHKFLQNLCIVCVFYTPLSPASHMGFIVKHRHQKAVYFLPLPNHEIYYFDWEQKLCNTGYQKILKEVYSDSLSMRWRNRIHCAL